MNLGWDKSGLSESGSAVTQLERTMRQGKLEQGTLGLSPWAAIQLGQKMMALDSLGRAQYWIQS